MSKSQVIAALTTEVAATLDASGHFVFGEPTPDAGATWVTQAQARQLALAYWRAFGGDLRKFAEQDRGFPIASNLSACPRTFFAESGYDSFPAELTRAKRRAYGAAWVVGLCNGSEQQVAVSVSVEATDLTIDESGLIVGARSGDFFSLGVQPGTTVPAMPELAAVATANRSRQLVDAVPRLRRGAQRQSAFIAVWTLELDAPVFVTGSVSGAERSRALLAVGPWEGQRDLRVLDANPNGASTPRAETMSIVVNGVGSEVVVTRRIDVPAQWEPITVRTP